MVDDVPSLTSITTSEEPRLLPEGVPDSVLVPVSNESQLGSVFGVILSWSPTSISFTERV